MGTNTGHVMTLANSIIGVSVLAMPFCFKQCGIILGSLMLVISSIMSRLACYYLIKSSILARRRNFEFLAFHMFGPTGKLTVELCIIGFMLGTCVAFFVVMGDLGPAILGPILNVENPSSIRASVLIAIAVFVVLPLGLLRNVDSLAAISAATIAFYICLVLKVMGEATTHLMAWDWLDKVFLWRPAGLLQCIPIFSMALSCQTQLFEIFDSIPNATLDKMNVIVRSAVNLCTLMYMAMGFFGYIAFCNQPFSGNLMLSFSPTPTSEVIKMGFVLSVAVSFPLVIFPCRASLHSLLFRRGIPPHHELLSVSNHMPEVRFKCITLAIVAVSLVTGILIPNIELVLGLVGSTIGVLICMIIPATLFLCLTTKNNNERLLAQVLFVMGVLIMVLGSYANLYATEKVISGNDLVQPKMSAVKPPDLPSLNALSQDTKTKVQLKDEALKEIKNVEQLVVALPNLVKETPAPQLVAEEKADVRKEPPVPEAPVDKVVSEKPVVAKQEESKVLPAVELQKKEPPMEPPAAAKKEEVVIHGDALKKEDDEINEVQKQEILKKKEDKLIEKLEENKLKQQRLLEEQNKLLQDIKLEKEKLDEENKQVKMGGESPEIKVKEKKQNIYENEVIDEKKTADAVLNIPQVKNIPVVEEPKLINDIGSDLKDNVINHVKDSVINSVKDDIVKKNMADGLPLPLAIQHGTPHVDGVKSPKIVDNPVNPNEGNADSKVLRREILGEGEAKELREKRDLEEVMSFDGKEFESTKTEDVGVSKNEILVMKKVETESNVAVLSKEIPGNVVERGKSTKDLAGDGEKGSPASETETAKNYENKHCPDETKSATMKFVDDLKPLAENTVENNKPAVLKRQEKTPLDTKSRSDIAKKEATTTESIIKSPVYLSNPGLVLPAEHLEPDILEVNILNNVAKPMKRDLKSYDIRQQENVKETET